MGSPDRFDQRLPPELEGFGPAFFNDLRDLISCYGADVRGVEGIRRIELPTDPPCQATTTVPPSDKANLSVRTRPTDPGAYVILVLQDHPAVPYVQWDRRVTAAEVRAAMAKVDADMAHTRDPLSGRRRRVPSDRYATPQLRVDDTFKPGTVMVLGEKIDPEMMRLQYDRPDDLVVLANADGKGHHGLRLKRDVVQALREDEVTERVLAKYGVKGQEQIDAMSHARLAAMLAEIEEELGKLG